MVQTGIDKLSFYTSNYFLDLNTLAEMRALDPQKFYSGIGQEKMGVLPPDEDVVSMAANATYPLLKSGDLEDIELLIFATESSIDQSKAAGLYVHGLLELDSRCRVVELKEACYSATAGLRMAMAMVAQNPQKKALVIASDLARYDLKSPGESTQGCGAVAMTVTAHPRLLAIDPESGFHADDIMDFWRPNYRKEALVDGRYSTQIYIQTLKKVWDQYSRESGRNLSDFSRFCYHIPFTRMAEKAYQRLARHAGEKITQTEIKELFKDAEVYSRINGNCYTASLYLALTSLLENCADDLTGGRIGLYSYGSGCMGEFFSGTVQDGYRDHLRADEHSAMLAEREELTGRQYEDIFHYSLPENGVDYSLPQYRTGPYRLAGISQHKRIYESLL